MKKINNHYQHILETDIPLIISIFATMALSAFFSGMEIAFVSSNRMLAEMDKERNGFSQKLISVFYRHPNGFVSTMLVGNNIVLVVYGILIAQFFDSTIFRGMDVGFTVPADTILSTLIILSQASFFPRRFSRTTPTACWPSLRRWLMSSMWCCGLSAASPRSYRSVCCAWQA